MATAKKTTSATKPAAKSAATVATKKISGAKPETTPEKAPVKAKAEKPVAPEKAAAPAKTAEVHKVAAKSLVDEPATVAPKVTAKKVAEKKEPVKNVKMPKINALGSVPYEPDFTHSVLDGPKENAPITTPSQRYSDSDLAEFRELIGRKLDSARKELAYLQGLITRKDETGGDNEDGRYMTMEDGTLSMEREQLSQMASRQIQFIDHLEKATMRIENKTYGICRETGKLIDKARLRAVPHATLSVEAKMRKNR